MAEAGWRIVTVAERSRRAADPQRFGAGNERGLCEMRERYQTMNCWLDDTPTRAVTGLTRHRMVP